MDPGGSRAEKAPRKKVGRKSPRPQEQKGLGLFRQKKFVGSRSNFKASAPMQPEASESSLSFLDITPPKPLVKRNTDSVRPLDEWDPKKSKVMPLARLIVARSRSSKVQALPTRIIHHLQDFDALMRPIDLNAAMAISQQMLSQGFRRLECVLVNDFIPEYAVKRHVLAGNARLVGARDCSRGMVYAQVVTTTDVLSLTHEVQSEWEDMGIEYDSLTTAIYTALELLVISAQAREPAPAPLTALQQVALIRTFVKNRACVALSRPRTFGGAAGLRDLMFGSEHGDEAGTRHFLLNNSISLRHKNKLLRGSRHLIETSVSDMKAPNGRSSVLDVLLHWEEKKKMPPFIDTHLMYCGDLSPERIVIILRSFAKDILTLGTCKIPVFCTQVIKIHKNICREIDDDQPATRVGKRRRLGDLEDGTQRDDGKKKMPRKRQRELPDILRRISDELRSHASGENNEKTGLTTEEIIDGSSRHTTPDESVMVEERQAGDRGKETTHTYENEETSQGQSVVRTRNEETRKPRDADRTESEPEAISLAQLKRELESLRSERDDLRRERDEEVERLRKELFEERKRQDRRKSSISDLKLKFRTMSNKELVEYQAYIGNLLQNRNL